MATNEAVRDEPADIEVKEFGKYMVSHPLICHGHWTIRGTRILVSIVLEQVADGLDWDTIVQEWRGKVPREAIFEAVLLARDALLATTGEDRTAAGLGLLSRT